MLFTREPIIETVITARSGFRLVVRNSKCAQEETLVDALEVVSFGHALFYRCIERPKAFLVPVSDYEIYEVRETRLVLKHLSPIQEIKKVKEAPSMRAEPEVKEQSSLAEAPLDENKQANKNDKRRDKRRQRRKKEPRISSDVAQHDEEELIPSQDSLPSIAEKESEVSASATAPIEATAERVVTRSPKPAPIQVVSALIPPPTMLVSDSFRNERLEYEASKQAALEGSEKALPVQMARHELIDALDSHNQETSPTQ